MNRRVLKIMGWVAALSLVLGAGAIAGGGIVYALTRADTSISLISAGPSDPEPGIVIVSVVSDGPAAEAGVVRGDILLQMAGEAVDNVAELMRVLQEHETGDEVELVVLHGDDERTLTATLGDQDGKPYLGLLPSRHLSGLGDMVAISVTGPGTMIAHVEPDGPADVANLQVGDIVIAIDGQELDSENNLADAITAHEPGDTVTLEVKRPGEEPREVRVELSEHPTKEGVAYLGVRYRPLPHFDALEGETLPFDRQPTMPFLHHIPGAEMVQGAIIRHASEDSPAAAADLRRGDVITAIEGNPIESPQDLIDAIADRNPGDRVTLTVYRSNDDEKEAKGEREVEVTLAEHPDEEGKAYLGVRIGGFLRMHHLEGDERLPRMDSFELHFDWEAPLDELPFEFDAVPDHFEFRFPPKLFEDELNIGGGDI
jgi:S1-C subfamily serine protease